MRSKRTPVRHHCMVVYAPYPLGETRVQREAEALEKAGYEVDVICVRTPGSLPVDSYKGVNIYREKYRSLLRLVKVQGLGEKFFKYIQFFFTAFLRLTRLHLHRRYSTIQVHNLPDFLVFCALIPRLLGVPVILDLHDLMPEFYAGRFGQGKSWPMRLIRLQERLACWFASHVITVSEHWRQALIRRGVPERKCSVVMNVADENIFQPLPQGQENGRGENGLRLIYHGALVERYGLDLAIRAIDRVRQEAPGIRLSLVGRGEHLPYLKRLVDELSLQEHVFFDDLHLAEELPGIISACDLGIVPYRNDVFTDGLLPTKLMEYAALGKPAIASRTTAIQAYFKDTMVEFFEPGDAEDLARCILTLYRSPKRLQELARGSQKFNQRYNWAKVSVEYVSLVISLGNQRARARKSIYPYRQEGPGGPAL